MMGFIFEDRKLVVSNMCQAPRSNFSSARLGLDASLSVM